jgi:glycosyltransferase involved in cell wall biosynthesis
MVSVIVATNRSSPYLAEALRSVGDQTHPRIEVIIVDDGSPDAGFIPAAARLVPGARIIRQGAEGVSVARNRGAEESIGDFLVFLDDDDRWHPTRLERQVASLARVEDAVLGYCRMRSIDENGATIAPGDQVEIADALDVARRTTGIIMPNVMIRRRAFEAAGGFSPALRLAEDLDLVLTLSRMGRFAFTDEILVDYRTHAANTTRSYRPLYVAIDEVLRDHLARANGSGDDALAAAFVESLRANDRFAWWSATRSARRHLRMSHPVHAAGDLAWAIVVAPRAPVSALGRRLRRSRG